MSVINKASVIGRNNWIRVLLEKVTVTSSPLMELEFTLHCSQTTSLNSWISINNLGKSVCTMEFVNILSKQTWLRQFQIHTPSAQNRSGVRAVKRESLAPGNNLLNISTCNARTYTRCVFRLFLRLHTRLTFSPLVEKSVHKMAQTLSNFLYDVSPAKAARRMMIRQGYSIPGWSRNVFSSPPHPRQDKSPPNLRPTEDWELL